MFVAGVDDTDSRLQEDFTRNGLVTGSVRSVHHETMIRAKFEVVGIFGCDIQRPQAEGTFTLVKIFKRPVAAGRRSAHAGMGW